MREGLLFSQDAFPPLRGFCIYDTAVSRASWELNKQTPNNLVFLQGTQKWMDLGRTLELCKPFPLLLGDYFN